MRDLVDGDTCLDCEKGVLREAKEDLRFKHVTITNQTVFRCSLCGSSFLNKDLRQRIDRILEVARKELS